MTTESHARQPPGRAADHRLDELGVNLPDASPALLGERRLLRRIDRKYAVLMSDLPSLIGGLDDYAVIRVGHGSWARYESLYFDTPDLRCFHDHRRGRRIRHKVRIRHYPDRAVTFFEIKTKRNELVTDKHRVELDANVRTLDPQAMALAHERVGSLADELVPTARIDYCRMTLVGRELDERVTIDTSIEVAPLGGAGIALGPFAIIEVKQAVLAQDSPIVRRLAAAGVRQGSVSKYVAAVARLFPHQQRNRLLPALRALARIAR